MRLLGGRKESPAEHLAKILVNAGEVRLHRLACSCLGKLVANRFVQCFVAQSLCSCFCVRFLSA